jgi:hypothetical protein
MAVRDRNTDSDQLERAGGRREVPGEQVGGRSDEEMRGIADEEDIDDADEMDDEEEDIDETD